MTIIGDSEMDRFSSGGRGKKPPKPAGKDNCKA